MKSVFIYNSIIDKQIKDLLNTKQSHIKIINVSQDIFCNERLDENLKIYDPYDYLSHQEYLRIVSDAFRYSRNWYNDFSNLFLYKDIQLWSIAEQNMAFLYIEIFRAVKLFKSIVASDSPEEFILYDEKSIIPEVFKAMSREHNITLRLFSTEIKKRSFFREYESSVTFYKFIIIKFINVIVKMIRKVTTKRIKTAFTILMVNYFRFSPIIEMSKSSKISNPNLLILSASKKQALASLIRRSNVNYILPMLYLTIKGFLSAFMFKKSLAQKSKMLDKIQQENRPLYCGVPLWKVSQNAIQNYIDTFFYNFVCFHEAVDSLLKSEKINTIVVNQDLEGYNKLLISAGNARGIRTICFQHGISPDLPDYGKHIAQVCALWGEHERRVYIKRDRAPIDSITVVGDPFLYNLKTKVFDKLAIKKKLGISPSRKVILVTYERGVTLYAAYQKGTANNKMLNSVCHAINDLSNVCLIIRAKERKSYSESYGDLEIVKSIIARNNNKKNILVDSTTSTYELLYISDLVIVSLSTIGLEAMLFHKPIIALNLDNSYDLMGYAATNAVFNIHNEKDLFPTMQKALFDPEFKRKLSESQKKFLKYNFINLDDTDPIDRIKHLLLKNKKE